MICNIIVTRIYMKSLGAGNTSTRQAEHTVLSMAARVANHDHLTGQRPATVSRVIVTA